MEISVYLNCLVLVTVIYAARVNHRDTSRQVTQPQAVDEYTLQKRRQMECVEEVRVDPDLVLKIKRGYWKSDPDPLLKQWALCALMKAGLMTAQGVYKIDVALAKVPDEDKESVEALIDRCLTTKAIPAIDIAYFFAKCYHQARGNYTLVSVL